jgi:hypothetical protein
MLGKTFWTAYKLERGAVILELRERYENEMGWREAA